MSSDEFDLFCTYLYLSGNKRVKSKLSIFPVFLMDIGADVTLCKNENSSGCQPKSSARAYFGILVECSKFSQVLTSKDLLFPFYGQWHRQEMVK